MSYYVVLFLLWLSCLFGAALFKEPFVKMLFHVAQGAIVGHAFTRAGWW